MGALMWARFFIPVLALFYIASQVPIEQFALIMSVFSLATLLLEIPRGVLADLLGKKKTLLVSRFLYIIEIFIIAFFNGFWPFLIAKIISGFGVSLSSGTGEAFLYDTLKRLKRENDYEKINGKLGTITNISGAFVFLIGGFLFSINYKLPALVSLPFIIIGFLLTFYYTEPYKNKRSLSLKNSLLQLKEGYDYLKRGGNMSSIWFYSQSL
jgi:MFS family permease